MTKRRAGPFDEPSEVSAEQGEVILDGPDGVAVSFTPDAAKETSNRLLYKATEAQGQRIAADTKKKRKDKPGG